MKLGSILKARHNEVDSLSEAVEMRKARYTKRTGSPGNYKYFYGKKIGKKAPKSEMNSDEKSGKKDRGLDLKQKAVEAIYDKYRSKDYFSDDKTIENKIEYWKQMGKPKPYTEEKIRNQMNENFKAKTMQYLTNVVNKIKSYDTAWLISNIRHDQKLLKEVFTEVTGRNINNYSNAQLKEVFNKMSGAKKEATERTSEKFKKRIKG